MLSSLMIWKDPIWLFKSKGRSLPIETFDHALDLSIILKQKRMQSTYKSLYVINCILLKSFLTISINLKRWKIFV